MIKRIAVVMLVLGIFIFGCSTSRNHRIVKSKETAVDTLFNGKGEVISINKHSEREEHKETYYYTLLAVLIITSLILFSKSKQ